MRFFSPEIILYSALHDTRLQTMKPFLYSPPIVLTPGQENHDLYLMTLVFHIHLSHCRTRKYIVTESVLSSWIRSEV